MVQVQKIIDRGVYPGIVSGPDDPLRYSGTIEWLVDRRESFIGSSYYYIREDQDQCVLCCLSITGGCLYSVDVIDHIGYGISNEDIDEAVRMTEEDPVIPGHFHIDIHIENKLRTLLDVAK